MTKTPVYILVGLLLALSVYLKSPFVGIFSVVLVGIEYAKDILLKNNIVKEVEDVKAVMLALQNECNQRRVKQEQFEKELTAITQRVRDTVGDGF